MRRLPLPTIVDPPCSGRVDNAGYGAESRRGRLYLFLRYFTTSQRCWVALLHCTGGDTLRQLALEDDEEDEHEEEEEEQEEEEEEEETPHLVRFSVPFLCITQRIH